MSGLKDPSVYRFRGVYGVYNGDELMYVGSTSLGLKQLEQNHRNAREKNYDMTNFRTILEQRGSEWSFVWLIKPFNCQQWHIEFTEQMLIQAMKPVLNVDMAPYKSSINYGRYKDVLKLYD